MKHGDERQQRWCVVCQEWVQADAWEAHADPHKPQGLLTFPTTPLHPVPYYPWGWDVVPWTVPDLYIGTGTGTVIEDVTLVS